VKIITEELIGLNSNRIRHLLELTGLVFLHNFRLLDTHYFFCIRCTSFSTTAGVVQGAKAWTDIMLIPERISHFSVALVAQFRKGLLQEKKWHNNTLKQITER